MKFETKIKRFLHNRSRRPFIKTKYLLKISIEPTVNCQKYNANNKTNIVNFHINFQLHFFDVQVAIHKLRFQVVRKL